MKTWQQLHLRNSEFLQSCARWRKISWFTFTMLSILGTLVIPWSAASAIYLFSQGSYYGFFSVIAAMAMAVIVPFCRRSRKETDDRWDEIIQGHLENRQIILDGMKQESEGEEWKG